MTFRYQARIAAAAAFVAMMAAGPAAAQTITFDDAVEGIPFYGYDSDGDSVADVIFSTSDEFFTVGPGEPQAFIDEPGLGAEVFDGPEMEVDFHNGLSGALGFGYAISNIDDEIAPAALRFQLFDSNDNLLADVTSDAVRGDSRYPENWVGVTFLGVAAYGVFDFDPDKSDAFIIDNMTLGSAAPPSALPEPATWLMMAGGLGAAGFAMRRRRTAATA